MDEDRSRPASQPGTLAEQELVGSLSWLIRLRWPAGLGVLVAAWFAANVLQLAVQTPALYLLGLGILAYNAFLWWRLGWFNARPTPSTIYQRFARFQIGLDWLATALLVYFSGGIESPAILIFLFHIVIASLLLPHDRAFLYVALAPILVGGLAWLEFQGIVPHVPVFVPARYTNGLYVAGVLAFFTASCYAMAYLSMTISRRLRRREDQLAALYETLQATTSTLDLSEVLDRLAEATAQALDCRAAAIRLLDAKGSRLEWAGVYGLSEEYQGREPIEVARAPLDQEVLAGETVLVPNITQDDRLHYPVEVAAEGIGTILSAPLTGKTGTIGVLRAYGGLGQRFTGDDEAFLGALAAQGAVAIENAQAYRMLEEMDRSKTEFVRTVTHELRSPVNVSSSLLKLLDRGYVGELNDKQAEMVGRARRRIEFLQALIDDLLDLAAGRSEVMRGGKRGKVSLIDVAAEVAERFEARAEEKNLAFHLEQPDEGLTVWGDRAELDRILNNLLSNAIKYTSEGGVRLQLERADGSARITVRDTGIGIPQAALPDLFQEFFRAPNAKDVEESGTGLGLSIVKSLVDRYGGQIEVESTEGQGTAFTVALPLSEG